MKAHMPVRNAVAHMLLAVSCLYDCIHAYPGRISSCSAWQVGDPGHMGAPTLTDGTGGDCVISTDHLPSSGFTQRMLYSITVSSSSPSLYKLYSSDGQCLGDAVSRESRAISSNFSWLAPYAGADNITFHALCSSGYNSLVVATLGPMSVALGANNSTITDNSTITHNSTITDNSTTTATGTLTATSTLTNTGSTVAIPMVLHSTKIPLGSTDMSLSIKPDGDDSIEFEMTVAANTWIGLGLAHGDTVSMSGSGNGAEIVTCSNGQLQRYWVTKYALTPPAADVPGSSCTQANGRTTLVYKRPLATLSSDRISVTPGRVQTIIFARGSDGEIQETRHAGDKQFRDGFQIDVAVGDKVEPQKRSGEAVLFLHLGLMSISWGCMLPLGAVVARRFKLAPWFWWHRTIQITGWAMQLLGFAAAVAYSQEYSTHFSSLHTWFGLFVVVTGTLQPVNAVFRPHKPADGEETGMKRKAWELLHKGGGWFILLVGVVTVFLGCMVVNQKGYDQGTLITACVTACVCVLVPVIAFIYSYVPGEKAEEYDNQP